MRENVASSFRKGPHLVFLSACNQPVFSRESEPFSPTTSVNPGASLNVCFVERGRHRSVALM